MQPLLTPQEMGARDEATIQGGTPGHVLMERAGRAVASAAIRLAGGRYGRRAVVVCAKGNNAGSWPRGC
jgi:NAD(P)H-hydrate repair Nnr-like enzyme with NAD(P)H-hydrate epimerase domain